MEKRKSEEPQPVKSVRRKIEVSECCICFEPHDGFACPQCAVWTCLPCFRKSLADYGITCMSCTTPIPEPRWPSLFSRHFIQTHLHEKAAVDLFNRFQAQLPGLQDAAEHEKHARQHRAEADRLLEAHTRLQESMKELKRQADAIRQEREGELREIRLAEMRRDNRVQTEAATGEAPVVRQQKCLTNGCAAFLDATMSCNMCERTYCGKCHALSHADMPCDPDQVESVNYIRTQTTPCPKCTTPIQRTEGCDQMYCVVPGCKTFFSKRTGKEITAGPLHNPHYVAALRAGLHEAPAADPAPALPGAALPADGRLDGCAVLPRLHVFARACRIRLGRHDPTESEEFTGPMATSLLNFHRGITHISAHLPELAQVDADEARQNRLSMIYFLTGSKPKGRSEARQELVPYPKEEFTRELKRHWKQHNRKIEETGILATCCTVARELLNGFVQSPRGPAELYQEIVQFVTLTNREIRRVAEAYGNMPTGLFILDAGCLRNLDYVANRDLEKTVAERYAKPALSPARAPAPAPLGL